MTVQLFKVLTLDHGDFYASVEAPDSRAGHKLLFDYLQTLESNIRAIKFHGSGVVWTRIEACQRAGAASKTLVFIDGVWRAGRDVWRMFGLDEEYREELARVAAGGDN